jgi:4-alpha-glucanotransferase
MRPPAILLRGCHLRAGTSSLDIQAEARRAGVLADYVDARGERRHVPPEALRRVLDALPKPASDLPAIVHRAGSGPIDISFERAEAARWTLRSGDRVVNAGNRTSDVVHLPDSLPLGAYRLDLLGEDGRVCAFRPVLVVPPTAFQGEFDRVWVLAVQLYSLRSERNWGIGDFTDLKNLIGMASTLGCAGIGLNPLHALFDDAPENCSPYAPNSRLFLNPVYIDVEAVEGFAGTDAATRDAIAKERRGPLIDYAAVTRWKLAALRLAFESFKADRGRERFKQFDAFRLARGLLLRRFAAFEVLRRHFARPWWEWPEDCQRPDADSGIHAVADGDEVEFVEYLQWIAHGQLQDCTNLAKAMRLKVGLYLDVAVGVRADGFDAWLEQGAVSRELSVGAPPDLLNTAGQDWGLSGFNGQGLAAREFEPFRSMIEASARYAGAIRLDHVMGLARLFLVPSGFAARDGAYVTMPLDPLLGVTALESQARRCIVVGEDLGTVPEGFRETLRDRGVWSYQVMMFEREHDGGFKRPDWYAANALVTFNTHDLPSYAGWRSAHDLRAKRALGIDPGETEDERHRAVSALDRALAENGIQGTGFAAVVEFLSRTPARVLSVALDDILGVVDQINVPGTVDEHPNWRRRLPVSIEDIAASYQAANMRAALAQRSHFANDVKA